MSKSKDHLIVQNAEEFATAVKVLIEKDLCARDVTNSCCQLRPLNI